MIRVAAAQFGVTNNVKDNLKTCVRMIKKAAECKPNIIVLPEFVNHNSWYDNQDHCFEVSLDIDGEFVKTIQNEAKIANSYISMNTTLRRPERKGGNRTTGTAILISPEGEVVALNNKQVLVGHENDFMDIADSEGPLIETPIGKIGLYSCMDGVINEPPRGLALRGAQILLNNINSFASDEGDLHIPVRATENKVFIVAANKVEPLIPVELLGPVSEATNIPVKFLSGAGDSQIVAPDGTILALAGKKEEVIWADIDPSQADNKCRPDGTNIFTSRRPDLYKSLIDDPATQPLPEFTGAIDVSAAAISINSNGDTAIKEASQAIKATKAKLVCLPELFWLENIPSTIENAQDELATSADIIAELQQACSDDQYVATSIVAEVDDKLAHCAVLISHHGIELLQPQVHFSERFSWSALANNFEVHNSIYGKISLTSEDDAIYPEAYRLIAMQGAEIVFAPQRQQEKWQSVTGLWERASENRVNIISADRNSNNNVICSIQKEFTIMTPWKERKFDGLLSACVQINGNEKSNVTEGEIHPQASWNKVCSQNTDLIKNRPWKIMQAFV